MSEKNFIFVLEKVTRFYQTKAEIVKAINGIDLKIEKGQFLVLLGPSGSGKTTLLNILSGLDNATSGSVRFQNQEMSILTDSQLCDLRRKEFGIIFQFYNMHPALTAQENIEYPQLIANIPSKIRKERALDLLAQFDLLEKKDNFPSELSGGEKQRIGIARALVNDPITIIADEPTGDLDSENAETIIDFLLDINRTGRTIVMVTHDESLLTEEMTLLHLEDGKLEEPY